MMRIVGVHGVGNYVKAQPAEAVAQRRSRDWSTAIAEGLNRGRPPRDLPLDVRVAYWAPLLHTNTPTPQGTAANDPDQYLDHLERVDPAARDLAAAWLEALDLGEVTAQGRLTAPLRHAVSVAADKFSLNGRLTKLFVATCFPEVASYLTGSPATRIAVRDHVAATIARQQPTAVIAHSLGTVITYEALHARPDLTVDLLITLGSPLALPHGVFHRLHPAPTDGIGTKPANVGRWINISDPGDPVAILRPITEYFPGIDLDVPDSISLFDFHRAAKYLSSTAVATTLHPYLT